MNDLIDRRKLIKDLVADCLKAKEELKYPSIKEIYKRIEALIDKQKQIKAKPVVKGNGYMKVRNNGGYVVSITCSACGYAHSRMTYNFCPECGADMRGGKNG